MQFMKSSCVLTAACLILAACGQASDSGAETPQASGGAQTEAEAAEAATGSAAPPAAAAQGVETASVDPVLKRGGILFYQCRSCHELGVDGPHKVGPNLHGLMNAKAAAKEGFAYSDALINSGIVWDAETLDGFIENPAGYVRGTKMAFGGIAGPSDREALIAYLSENTK